MLDLKPKGIRTAILIDIQAYYAKIANSEPVSDLELTALLKELALFRKATTLLAECQSATLESLPKSTSKSARGRHIEITRTAAELLAGDDSRVGYSQNIVSAQQRCTSAVAAEGAWQVAALIN